MAENRVTFIKSKMNKDLDDRIVPAGEYRDAQNVSVSRSEDADVGALENVLGNLAVSDFGLDTSCGIEVIGYLIDEENNRIFTMMTNYTDNSSDRLSNKAYPITNNDRTTNRDSLVECYIGMYSVDSASGSILVGGSFLNFSKTHPITGINLLEDLLFWTDNRNQPRKINVNNAINNPFVARYERGYYYTEDHISVAKYYPWQPIDLLDKSVNITGTDPFESTMKDVVSPLLPDESTVNPDYDPTWSGDAEYLKDRFIRFSYRFKFDDGEYSLIAPFTQIAFVPEQDGYFIDKNIADAYKSTELSWFRNKVNQIQLRIPAPSPIFYNQAKHGSLNGLAEWQDVFELFKITEIDILYKESDGLSIKIIDTITKESFANDPNMYLTYSYDSKKPYKTLPNKEIVRVYDQVPIRALSQEIVGNRVVYGNYQDKGTSPNGLTYDVTVANKNAYTTESWISSGWEEWNNIKEYQNHTLKQNRTYKVGLVLCDRYGRQSTPIFSTFDADYNNELGSTIYHPYKDMAWMISGGLANSSTTWPGDNLEVVFYNTIPDNIVDQGYPGLFASSMYDISQGGYKDATGWYSIKVVVKQTEQEYYNVFFPGVLSGNFHTLGSTDNPEIHIVLQSDNINKIPRSLQDVGPEQQIFRTSKPSNIEEDKAYIKNWLINAGMGMGGITVVGVEHDIDFDMDQPKIKELLAERDRLEVLDNLRNKDNSSVEMWLRVRNKYASLYTPSTLNVQYYPQPVGRPLYPPDTVTLIGKASDLGLYTLNTTVSPITTLPTWAAGSTYDYQSNPLIAKIKPNSPPQWGVKSTSTGNWMIPELSIYETAPVESHLDIYWETSTSYPITWLNYKIQTEDITLPMFIMDYASTATGGFNDWTAPISIFNENNNAPFMFVSDPICMVNPGLSPTYPGSVLTSADMQLISVKSGNFDGTQVIDFTDVTSDFTLVPGIVGTTWSLRCDQNLYCAPNREWYEFTIMCTNSSGVSSNITFRCRLGNTKANIVVPSGTPTISGSKDGGLLYTLQAENGTTKTGENNKDLHWHISLQKVHPSGPVVDYFYLVEDPVDGQIQLWNKPMTAAEAAVGTFNVYIKVKDRPWINYFDYDATTILVNIT